MDTYTAVIPAAAPVWLPGFNAEATRAAVGRIMLSKTVELVAGRGVDAGLRLGALWLVLTKDPTVERRGAERFAIAGAIPPTGSTYVIGKEYMRVAAVVFRLCGSTAPAFVILEGAGRAA